MRGYESKTLDYKGPCKWEESDKKACCEIVKDILAMSNSGGGYLVIGVSETGENFQFVGLSSEELQSYETSRINRFLQNYVDPPINCIVVKEQIDEQIFVVIEIPGFMETPHLCQKEFPGVLKPSGLYVRTDNNESALVQSSADFRKVIERAVRNKEDQLLESFRAILTNSKESLEEQQLNERYEAELIEAIKSGTGATYYDKNIYNESKYNGYREFWCYPSKYIQDRFTLSQLNSASRSADTDFRGWPFLYYGNNREDRPYAIEGGIEAKVRYVDFANQDRADYWQFRQSGLFYHRRLMWEESCGGKIPEQPLMLFPEPALHAAEGLHAMIKLFENLLDPNEEMKVVIRVNGTQGRMLISDSGPLSMQYISRTPSITFEKTRSLADWRAGLTDHALEITGFILERFNWLTPNLGTCKNAIEKMFSRRI
jgi:hypothetical protein